jgi:beta-lactamase superfamily II metal-dependent hydrolase
MEFLLWHKRAILALFLVAIVVSLFFLDKRSHAQLLRVTFLDVGQGDSVLIEGPNGNQVLYDAGSPDGKE